jgi:hypothetical protein
MMLEGCGFCPGIPQIGPSVFQQSLKAGNVFIRGSQLLDLCPQPLNLGCLLSADCLRLRMRVRRCGTPCLGLLQFGPKPINLR